MSNMNRLDINRRALVVKALCEGMGLRATARLTGVARMTVEKLLRDLGAACAEPAKPPRAVRRDLVLHRG
jgi:DNA-directed RNA polymerase specialized sigma24 family protein